MCDEYKIFLLSEGELNYSEKDILLKHIEECKECNKLYKEYLYQKNGIRKFYTDLQHAQIKKVKLPYRENGRYLNKTAAVPVILIILAATVFLIYKVSWNSSTVKQQAAIHSRGGYDIFDTNSWNKKMYSMEINLEQIKKLQSNPL